MFPGPLAEQSLDQVKQIFETNTFAVLRICKAVVPIMAKRNAGTIVNIGSVMGNLLALNLCKMVVVVDLTPHPRSSSPWSGAYCASKAALNSISEVLYMELKPFGIHVLHVAAGAVKSNIATNGLSHFSLPENSLYGKFVPNIIDRANSSQDYTSVPTKTFAKKVVENALKQNPPRYMTAGGRSFFFSIVWWLPRGFVLYLMWKRFS